MEIKCIIVDDEPPAQRVLENYILEIPTLKLEAKCKDALEATAILMSKKIDLIFLDINMPKISGLDFLKSLKNPPIVIITTAYRDYAVEGFELDVLDYLKKPFSLDRFMKSINKVSEKLNPLTLSEKKQGNFSLNTNEVNSIFIKHDRITYQISLDDILFIESTGDYIKVITKEKSYITKQTIKKIELTLPTSRFIRVHKSYIISLSKIDKIDGNLIYIGQYRIPLGNIFRKIFWNKINDMQ